MTRGLHSRRSSPPPSRAPRPRPRPRSPWSTRRSPRCCRPPRSSRSAATGRVVTYSRKVFIPLTQLCRDVCHYCTFAQAPRALRAALPEPRGGVEDRARRCRRRLQGGPLHPGRQAGAALRPRAPGARCSLGFASTLEYLEHCAREVHAHTGLLPHLNPGVMTADGSRPAAPGVGVDGPDARERQRAAVRARRAALRLPGQAAGSRASPRSPPPARSRCPSPPDSSSASARRGASGSSHCWRCARCTRATGTCRKSSSRTSAPSAGTRMAHAPEPDARGAAVDARGHAPDLRRRACRCRRRRTCSPGSSTALVRAGRQRLGRGLPGDPGPREPGGPVAAPASARARTPRPPDAR